MTTLPITAVRQALDDTEAALARLRPALADAYGNAGENLTRAAGQLDVAERARDAAEHRAEEAERKQHEAQVRAYTAEQALRALRGVTDTARAEQAEQDAERFKADHQAACETIAEMHEAATGRTGMGPLRGVVEDVADVRARAEKAEQALAAAEHRIGLLYAVDEGRAHGARRIMRERDQAQQRLDKHRRALAAIFARPAETPLDDLTEYAAKTLTRSGERLLDAGERLAAAEKARAEAERVAERATNTLLRIKHARTAADVWTALGTHYHLSPTEAGRRARDWRSTAELEAIRRAETAETATARVRALHAPADHNGRSVCVDCSGYTDGSTDNGPAPYPCPTLTALDTPTEG